MAEQSRTGPGGQASREHSRPGLSRGTTTERLPETYQSPGVWRGVTRRASSLRGLPHQPGADHGPQSPEDTWDPGRSGAPSPSPPSSGGTKMVGDSGTPCWG